MVAKPKSKPIGLNPDGLKAYRAELVTKRDSILGQLRQLAATGGQLTGALNQIAGELIAVDRIMGKAAEITGDAAKV